MAALTLTTDEVLRAMCRVAGVSREPADLDAATQSDFRSMIRDGLRAFYNQVLDENGRAHTWRFLERAITHSPATAYATGTVEITGGVVTLTGGTWPAWAADGLINIDGQRVFVTARTSDSLLSINNAGLVVAAGTAFTLYDWRQDLPSDFGEVLGGVVYHRANYGRLLTSSTDAAIRLFYATSFTENDTTHYAVQAGGEEAETRKTYLEFWPPPPAESSIHVVYRAIPADGLDDDDLTLEPTFVQVGALHAGTVKAAILAEVERGYHDEPGVYAQQYERLLAASIKHDLAMQGPTLGQVRPGVDLRKLALFNHVPSYADQIT